jgi:hypothetical protein
MSFTSKKISLLILGITSLVCSRTLFLFFNDPEGPNLLVVIGMAAIIFFLSLAAYAFCSSVTQFKRILITISVQILLVIGFYFLLS